MEEIPPRRFLSMLLYLCLQAHMASAVCVSAHTGAPDVLQKIIKCPTPKTHN